MFKRHFILLLALLSLPFFVVHKLFFLLSVGLILAFVLSLFRDEIIFRKKSTIEILLTFPVLVIIEMAHFWGSLVGLMRFRVLAFVAKK